MMDTHLTYLYTDHRVLISGTVRNLQEDLQNVGKKSRKGGLNINYKNYDCLFASE